MRKVVVVEGAVYNFSDYFYYDETSISCLRWNTTIYRGRNRSVLVKSKGDVAGFLNKTSPYFMVGLHNRRYQVSRVIWQLHNDAIPTGFVVDHIDGNSLNNNITNLRVITQTMNCRNKRVRRNSDSGIQGVMLSSNGSGSYYWLAQWTDLNGKTRSKTFSILKYGNDTALELATKFRLAKLSELQKAGAGYTERHLEFIKDKNDSI